MNPHTGMRRIDQAFPAFTRKRTRTQDMAIEFTSGSLWRVVGSDNYNSLVGSTPRGVIFSEWALADPAAWAFLRPILMENKGWAIFITTPRGENHAKKMLDFARSDPEWFAETLTVDDTGIFTKEALDKELREMQSELGVEEGVAQFDQEYHCSFQAALIGAYYGVALRRMQKEDRIGNVPIDRGVLVHTSWDLGIADSTAIWFIQCVGKERPPDRLPRGFRRWPRRLRQSARGKSREIRLDLWDALVPSRHRSSRARQQRPVASTNARRPGDQSQDGAGVELTRRHQRR